jgi:nucleoside-diphosphate-sugar epimerase
VDVTALAQPFAQMKSTITGGAGFVDSHLADELLQHGCVAAVGVGQSTYQIAEIPRATAWALPSSSHRSFRKQNCLQHLSKIVVHPAS